MMKLIQLKQIIKEEIKKALKEAQGTYENGIWTGLITLDELEPSMLPQINLKFKNLIKVTGPIEGYRVPATINIKNLIKAQQSGRFASLQVFENIGSIMIELRDSDIVGSADNNFIKLTRPGSEVMKALKPYETKEPITHYVLVQIAPSSRYYSFEDGEYGLTKDYKIPTILKNKLVGKRPSRNASDADMRRYILQIQNELTPIIKTAIPNAKFSGMGVGALEYELVEEPTTQQKSKLKSLLKGALNIKFTKTGDF
jgi:hypothetical protein